MTQPALTATPPAQAVRAGPTESGRGTAILVLGILSIVMLGFITGIPAWVMGHTDLKKIRMGVIAATEEGLTKAGMILGIIGTAISGLMLLLGLIVAFFAVGVGLSLFSAQNIETQRKAIRADIHALASHAMEYRITNGSFAGYQIPQRLKSTDRASFTVRFESPDQLHFTAKSREVRGTIRATLTSGGELTDWIYEGDFDVTKESEEREASQTQT